MKLCDTQTAFLNYNCKYDKIIVNSWDVKPVMCKPVF